MTSVEDAERALARADDEASVDALVAHLSTAVRGFTEAGDARRAAMACVRLGDVLANAIGNHFAGRVWFERARRLLADVPVCIEHGWVAVAAMGCDVGDPVTLLRDAELALDVARRFGDVNLEAKALADAGLAHVQAGRDDQGMAMLDEAMALVCGPVDDLDAAGKSACSFFTACYYAASFERAATWAELLGRRGLIGPGAGAPVFLSNHCDTVRAYALVELGRWTEAEALLEAASTAFERAMGAPSWHPAIALADLRIAQGRLTEAEQLLIGRDHAFEALLPTARLHLARGDHELAVAVARRGLDALGSDRLRAIELDSVLVTAALARGDVAGARAACVALDERAAQLTSATLFARTAIPRARVLAASGRAGDAIGLLELARRQLDPAGSPWLVVRLSLALARVHAAEQNEVAVAAETDVAASALTGLDVVLDPDDARLLELRRMRRERGSTQHTATLAREGTGWLVECDGVRARVPDTKGIRYVAALVARPGAEQHSLDLVDRVEGVDPALDRRTLGDAGELSDARARTTYRHRIEALRSECDDALERGDLDEAERLETEIDALVTELARAFGLGGRGRRASSTVERARLNVTRAIRAAVARLADTHPEAAAELDRRIRTGTYCAYEPEQGDRIRWIVQS